MYHTNLLKNNFQILIEILTIFLICLISSLFSINKVHAYTLTYNNKTFNTTEIFTNIREHFSEDETYSEKLADDYYNRYVFEMAVIDRYDPNVVHFYLFSSSVDIYYFSFTDIDDYSTYTSDYNFRYATDNDILSNNISIAFKDSRKYLRGSSAYPVFCYDYNLSNNTGSYIARTNYDIYAYNKDADNVFEPILYTNFNLAHYLDSRYIINARPYDIERYNLNYTNAYGSEMYGMNYLKYFDIYVSPDDFQKQIGFTLEFTNYNDLMDNSFFHNKKISINGFDIAYMIEESPGMYKWVSDNDLGLYIDYDSPTLPIQSGNMFIFNGTYSTIFDTSQYNNVRKIKISIEFTNTYNYNLNFSSNGSNTTTYDEYMATITSNSNRLYRNFIDNNTKYMFITTTSDTINEYLYVENYNTDKYLYRRYFDTFYNKYVDEKLVYRFPQTIKDRFFENEIYTIGTTSKRGIYLLSYLPEDNLSSLAGYNIYLPSSVYFSYSDTISHGIFYNSNEQLSTGVEPNSNDQKDDLSFYASLAPYREFLSDMTNARIVFNESFDKIYNSMPIIVRTFLTFITHIACLYIMAKMLGWSED